MTDSKSGHDLDIQRCGIFDEDDTFLPVRDRYRLENQDPSPDIKKIVSDPNIHKLSSDADAVFVSDEKFELIVDIRGYNWEDIRCTATDNTIEISALQNDEEMDESRKCERSMTMNRKYQLPSNINPQTSVCKMSSDGFLYIVAHWNK